MPDAASAVISALIAAAVSVWTTRTQWKKQVELDREREREKQRISYLDPLLVAATDFLRKIEGLLDELKTNEKFWTDAFSKVKSRDRNDPIGFAHDCNGFDAGAITTLFVTAVYLSRATKIRSELPFIQLGPKADQTLIEKLDAVRSALGGKWNLWEELQDSIGSYMVGTDGHVINYKAFCAMLMDPYEHIWLIRLLDFYKDVHLKANTELPHIKLALENLIDFAKSQSQPKSNGERIRSFLESQFVTLF